MTDTLIPQVVDLRKYIDTATYMERPHIRGRSVAVAQIAHSGGSQGWDVAELAYQFTLSETQVLAALLYYEEYRDEIEAQEAAYQKLLDEAYERGNKG